MRLSNEVLCILVVQGNARLPEVKVGNMKKDLGFEPGPHSNGGADWAEWQNFFQTSNFDVSFAFS